METTITNDIELSRDPAHPHLVRVRFLRKMVGTGEAAQAMLAVFELWIRETPGRFGIWIDCANITSTEPAWRAVLAEFCRKESGRLVLAWYNASPFIVVLVNMFIVAARFHTSFDGKVFRTEAEASAWLSSKGF
jgi:hypothetical protein